MMLTLTVFYEIPQLNLGQLFTGKENLNKNLMKKKFIVDDMTESVQPTTLVL